MIITPCEVTTQHIDENIGTITIVVFISGGYATFIIQTPLKAVENIERVIPPASPE